VRAESRLDRRVAQQERALVQALAPQPAGDLVVALLASHVSVGNRGRRPRHAFLTRVA
jgi:hypothetical protein